MTTDPESQEPGADEAPMATTVTEPTGSRPNVGRRERLASAALGGVLLVRGLRRRSLAGVASALAGGALVYRGVTGHSYLYEALGSGAEAEHEGEGPAPEATAQPTVERSITIDESPDELAERLRDPEQLDRIVGPFADVASAGAGEDDERHRWRVEAPFGRTLEWEMLLADAESDERLRWRSEDAPIPNEYTLSFEPAPADRGTQVAARVQYDPPGGALGNAAMDRLGFAPEALLGTALRRLKSLAETGEIPTTEANPSARGKGDLV